MSQRLTKDMIEKAKKLSYADRIELACQMFGCSGTESDNTGQIVLYTECKWMPGDKIRKMTSKDFR